MKTILVTGGAGFIGSNFIRMMLSKYSDYHIINVDALTYASNLENLSDIEKFANYIFIKADIRDSQAIDQIFNTYSIDYLVNFAAESHVDRSILGPEVFLSTNIMGTQVLLDRVKKHWKLNPDDKHCKLYKSGVKFLQISTDEVYGDLGEEGLFTESMPLSPNSPYSASKASADLIVRSYNKTFGLPINISRSSNNYGPYQFPEKLIPLVINNCLEERQIPVYGNGKQIRDWIHVCDHCQALDMVLHRGEDGQVYNIGGNNEKANIDILEFIIEALGKSNNLIEYVKDRPGHDIRYAIDNTKIKNQLGWKATYNFEKGLKETIIWYSSNRRWMEKIVSGEYAKYYHNMYAE